MSSYPEPPPAAYHSDDRSPDYAEKASAYDEKVLSSSSHDGPQYEIQEGGQRALNRSLKGRHMQMIAIGGWRTHYRDRQGDR